LIYEKTFAIAQQIDNDMSILKLQIMANKPKQSSSISICTE